MEVLRECIERGVCVQRCVRGCVDKVIDSPGVH